MSYLDCQPYLRVLRGQSAVESATTRRVGILAANNPNFRIAPPADLLQRSMVGRATASISERSPKVFLLIHHGYHP